MEEIITLKCGGKTASQIAVGPVSKYLPHLIGKHRSGMIAVTDANVYLHNRELIDSFDHIIIDQGESGKSLANVEIVFRKLLSMNADRSSFILGIGGGVVTDLTGFAASTYMRGLRFGFIPTTLLAQVDAGIGGKNGVNLDGYKNIIGLFSQPEFVICDPAILRTLPSREMLAGLAEVIKAGIIGDPALFELLENHSFEEICSDTALLKEMIVMAVKVKTAIVESDEREAGRRRVLNLGHTLAHAMEKNASLYSHGEAVAAGIALTADAAVRLGKLAVEDAARIKRVIGSAGLPLHYPIEMKKLLAAVKFDKKREGGGIYMVFPTAIGRCETLKMRFEEVENLFDRD